MIAKLIPTRVHGVLDYLTGLALIAIPLLFNWPQPEATIFMVLGGGALVYSLLTRYELGVFKLLPMPVHLVLDLLSGLFLVAAPFIGLVREDLQGWFWAFGIFEIAAALLTSTRPHLAHDDHAAGATGAGATGDVRYTRAGDVDAPYASTAMTGRNTTIGEGDRDTRYGTTNTTYTGSSQSAGVNQQATPDEAGWTTATAREEDPRIEHNRDTTNR
jgi:hypothetical protein